MKKTFFTSLMLAPVALFGQKQFTLQSPSGLLKTEITISKTISYAVLHQGDAVLASSAISMSLADGTQWGVDPHLIKNTHASVKQDIASPFYKKSSVKDHYNELKLHFKGNYSVTFRAYDEGVAYRFEASSKKPFFVANEQAEFSFPKNGKAYIPYVRTGSKNPSLEAQYFNSFENIYHVAPLSEWDSSKLAFLPIVVESAKGKKVCLAEADLLSYPGMFLSNASGSKTLKGVFAPYPKDVEQGGHNMLQEKVLTREPYIARFSGDSVAFPWRIVIVAEKDSELADNDMVYKLASPNRIADASWIKPGKVMWDWWNDWNIYGVDFRAGINNNTYKYYIDAASQLGLEYVILDEGWAVNKKADLMQVVPEINLPELVRYGASKNVGIILWGGYYAFNRDLEAVCKHYSEMGVKGFKVDFMDRDDQAMVDFYLRTAATAAKYHLLVNFHGAYKPTGLQRTYPNVLNVEAVFGLEQMKWDSNTDQVAYELMIPFIRMVAGPMDYTQGAMRNATKRNYRAVYSEAMSQGTRCRQLAQYVIFESPLNMMCDAPSAYLQERECAGFIAAIPTVWDETKVIDGAIGKYVAIARRNAGEWYVGGIGDWSARSVEVDLAFLGEGSFTAEIFRDGVNADRAARDYVKETIAVPANRKITVHIAPGGGYAMKIGKEAR
ncbi:MAG: glycoside hydrolase family 97 protein [Prevotellaceae bacterium]|nr:glycoside hydrolase family 97 protein [Prevotellaceae bacterium]